MIRNATDDATGEPFSLTALKAGDKEEFSHLVDAYSGKLYRLVWKLLGNPLDAEDVLQETYLKAFRNIQSFNGRSKLSTWLYRIATNEALMLLRRKKPEAFSLDAPIDLEDGEQIPVQIVDWCCLPEEELISSEARYWLDVAVEKLPQSLKVVFLLRDVEGLSTQETAEILELSDTAVKTRLSRARLRLREELSSYFSEKVEQKNDDSR